jgi:acyl carrier protein
MGNTLIERFKDEKKAIEVLDRVHDWLGVVIRDGKCDDHCSVCIGASDLADDVWEVLHPEGVKKDAPADVVPDAPAEADFVPHKCPETGGECKMKEQEAPAAKEEPKPMDQLEKRVLDIVAEELCVDRGRVTLDSDFNNDLGADSLDGVELVMAFEEEFGFAIPEEDAANVHTPRQAVEYLRAKGY